MIQSSKGNSKTNVNSPSGGSSRVTIPATPFQVAGSDIACKYCRLQCGTNNTSVIRVRIDTACTSTTGVALPSYPTLTPYTIDNLAKLNFVGLTQNDVVDIEYFD